MAAQTATGPKIGLDELERLLSTPPQGDRPIFVRPPKADGDSPIFVGRTLGQSPGRTLGQSPEPVSQQLDGLLSQVDEAAEPAACVRSSQLPRGAAAYRWQDLSDDRPAAESATVSLIRDVQLTLKIELGRTHMYLEEALKLRSGSVVPLDQLADEPVDVYVDGRQVARGEVLMLDDKFCVRVTELTAETDG
jgi:flagellar motor switch protein FliN